MLILRREESSLNTLAWMGMKEVHVCRKIKAVIESLGYQDACSSLLPYSK